MGTILASALITNARRLLQDESNVATRWTDATLLAGLNEAQLVLVNLKHDASTETRSIVLNGTTKNSIPADSIALVKVTRNMGAAGTTPGRPISQVGATAMDMADPTWHSAAAATSVYHFIVDPRLEREFYVWPATSNYVEIIHVVKPTAIANTATAITLDDIYAPALTAYAVYYGLSQDMDAAPNRELAQIWLGQFAQLVTGKVMSEEAIKRVSHNIP